MPGSVMSSMYCACPVTLSRPSLRGTDTPTIVMRLIPMIVHDAIIMIIRVVLLNHAIALKTQLLRLPPPELGQMTPPAL